MYSLYKIAFKTYKKLKNIKNHIKSWVTINSALFI
jgi:hypothetical protein